jgi:hypothetical protein
MTLVFKLWARVEVENTISGEHEDLDSEVCEYKLFESESLSGLSEFIIEHQSRTGNHEDGVLLDLEDALNRQGFNYKENDND